MGISIFKGIKVCLSAVKPLSARKCLWPQLTDILHLPFALLLFKTFLPAFVDILLLNPCVLLLLRT